VDAITQHEHAHPTYSHYYIYKLVLYTHNPGRAFERQVGAPATSIDTFRLNQGRDVIDDALDNMRAAYLIGGWQGTAHPYYLWLDPMAQEYIGLINTQNPDTGAFIYP
jgi:hypothetical protein